MSDKLQAALDSFEKHSQTPEYQARVKTWIDKMEWEEKIHQVHIDRFYNAIKFDFGTAVQKILNKYDSKAYNDRYYKRGVEPHNSLFYLLYDIAEKYGRVFTPREYAMQAESPFYNTTFALHGWAFNCVSGMGSFIQITKHDDPYDGETPPKIIFDKHTVGFILEALGYTTDDDGYVCKKTKYGIEYAIDQDGMRFEPAEIIAIQQDKFIT